MGCFKPEFDLDFHGGNINNGFDHKTESALECYHLCLENSECEMYVWHSTRNKEIGTHKNGNI